MFLNRSLVRENGLLPGGLPGPSRGMGRESFMSGIENESEKERG